MSWTGICPPCGRAGLPLFSWSGPPQLSCRPLLRESQQKVADIFLARAEAFGHHTAHILQFDRYLGLLGETCLHSPRLAAAVREFEVSAWPSGPGFEGTRVSCGKSTGGGWEKQCGGDSPEQPLWGE